MSNEILEFGKWKGTRFGDTPEEYQEWAARLTNLGHPQLARYRIWAAETIESRTKLMFGKYKGVAYRNTQADYRKWAISVRKLSHHQLAHYQQWVMEQEWEPRRRPEFDAPHMDHISRTAAEQEEEWQVAWKYTHTMTRGTQRNGER